MGIVVLRQGKCYTSQTQNPMFSVHFQMPLAFTPMLKSKQQSTVKLRGVREVAAAQPVRP